MLKSRLTLVTRAARAKTHGDSEPRLSRRSGVRTCLREDIALRHCECSCRLAHPSDAENRLSKKNALYARFSKLRRPHLAVCETVLVLPLPTLPRKVPEVQRVTPQRLIRLPASLHRRDRLRLHLLRGQVYRGLTVLPSSSAHGPCSPQTKL